MAKGNIDLDRSLDDIIKNSKTRQPKSGKPATGGAAIDSRRGGRRDANNRGSVPSNRAANSRGGGKSNAINRRVGKGIATDRASQKNINSRLSKGGISKPQLGNSSLKRGGVVGRNHNSSSRRDRGQSVTQASIPITRGSIDPKSLVITKAITHNTKTRNSQSGENIIIRSNVNQNNPQKPVNMNRPQNYQQQQQQQQQQPQSSYSNYSDQHHQGNASFNNTASSYPVNNALPQRNIVLICNLDPRATAEDVGEACSMFGPILSCDILLDPMGRPLNEAEIEFLYPSSAEECVSKLDNGMADGRVLRARLQSSATLPVVPRYSSRTVIASARVAPGGFDNNQQHPIMHQNQDNIGNHYSNSSAYPQQYQRRF